ncbi:hypothetical protein J7394_13750 [Ruegeria sp. R13_0]|uniref:hypothetical protein n=1 Tax=Ruegeria sp. R13_0 TaxID=2821099 RepID=UPI001ADB63D5|nr:hypothetical protein [Ruegeria sp. R13_0]MBO9435276.1 hypothetical protein [Ruegeria sp. R13_0]
MRFLWRWLKRLTVLVVVVVLGLLSPVAYAELMCRPKGEPEAYQALLDPAHYRSETRTLLTYPEWHIVHAYEDYARVLETGDPHEYQFIKGVSGFWDSVCALSKNSGQLGPVDGATKQMVYVIGVSFTAELLAKAVYEETVGRLFAALRGPDRAQSDDLSAQQAKDYAEFLQQVPWYKWDFRADAQALADAEGQSPRDHERRIALGAEYRAKAAYAEVIAAAVSEVGADALTLRMIVSGATVEALSSFDGVTVIGKTNSGIEVETVRYRALTQLMQEMANTGVEFVEIAGNDLIMFTIVSENAEHPRAIYSDARQGFADHRHLILTEVTNLASDIRALDGGTERLEHIHDY